MSAPASRAWLSSSSVSTSTSTGDGRAGGASRGDRSRDRAGGHDVVLLDEDAVVETHAVVAAAGAEHGVLLCAAQPGERLARIEDARGQAGHDRHVAPGDGRRAGKRLQEVQRGPLAGEQRPGRAREPAQALAGSDVRSLAGIPLDAHGRIDLAEHFVEPGPAAKDGGLARDHGRAARAAGGNERGREVAGADVLVDGAGYLLGQVDGGAGMRPSVRAAGRAWPSPCTAASGSTARSWSATRAWRPCGPGPSPRPWRRRCRGSSSGSARSAPRR